MRAAWRNYLVIGVTALAFAVGIGWRQSLLAEERARLEEQKRKEQLKAELEAERVNRATRASADEIVTRDAERIAWVELLSELEGIRRRMEAAEPAAKSDGSAPSVSRPTLRETALSVHQWRESGTATPEAALETALWAAAHGNLDRLTMTLAIDAEVRARATMLFERLPPAWRQELGTTERFVAMLTADAVPLGTAQILDQSPPEAKEPYLLARIADAEGKSRTVKLAMRTDGGQWRVVVPAIALDRFTAKIAASGTR